MAPSSLKKIGAAVACATAVRAATETYQLTEEYTADNFFDKFDFFVSTYTSGDSWDSTHGYVRYRSQAEAESMGLISTSNGSVYIGADHTSTYDPDGKGRDSVKMTSKDSFGQGLMIAKFSHMPVQACGTWPAFWSYGSPWLTKGEIDFYEGWNEPGYNRMAMHTNGTLSGACTLSSSGVDGTILTSDCNQGEDMAGCGVADYSGAWASSTGATFAMLWTDAAIKIYSWADAKVPDDVTAGEPDPTSGGWGNPTLLAEQDSCDLSSSFADLQLVFDIDFCGDAAGLDYYWNQTCSASTGTTCTSYVANNPSAFADSYFEVEAIRFYELGVAAASSSSSSSSSSSTAVTVASTTAASTSTSASASSGILGGVEPVVSSLLASTTSATSSATYSHSTGYVYATSVHTDEVGAETTVVLTVDTTICPITASEASASSAAMASSMSASIVEAQTQTTTMTTTAIASGAPATQTGFVGVSNQAPPATGVSIPVSSVSAAGAGTGAPTSIPLAATGGAAGSGSIPPAAQGTGGNSPVQGTGASAPVQETPSSASSFSSSSSSSISTTVVPAVPSATNLQSTLQTLSTLRVTASTARTASVEVISATDVGTAALETATASPTSVSLSWLYTASSSSAVAAAAETTAAAAAAAGSNGTATSSSSSATKSSSCQGTECIVVSNSGSRLGGGAGGATTFGASGLALAAFVGAAFLL